MHQRQSRLSKIHAYTSRLSIQYFHQLIPEITHKTRRQKKLDQIEEYVKIYEIYMKMLLGQDVGRADEKRFYSLNNITQLDENTIMEFDLPEAVISLPNPDMIPDEYDYIINQLEIFEQIVMSLQIDDKSIHDKLFIKAIENAFTHLADRKIYSLFELKTRGLDQNQQQQRNTLVLFGTSQQLFQKSPDRSPHSLILVDNNINQINRTSDYPIYKKEDQLSKLVKKFRNYLKDNISHYEGSLNNITDCLQVDMQKLVYVQKKAYSQGEYLKLQGQCWYRTRNETSDTLTLIRNALIIQLSRKGFNVKSFISKDGQTIYLCLYMTEKMLEIAAENFSLPKKLSFCFTDLLSLEPVDKQYRPLRLNGRLWRSEEYNNSPYLEYLRPLIVDQIIQINFKRLAREIGQSGLNNELFEYGKSDLYGDQDGPSDEEWTAYYKYLVHLNKHIKIERDKNQIDSDIALCIDKQKTVEQLYRIRTNRKEQINLFTELEDEASDKISEMYEKVRELIDLTNNIPLINNLPKLKSIKLIKQQQLAHNYLCIFQEALKVANCSQHYLKTIWDRYYQKPFELYIPFKINYVGESLKNIVKYQLKWCRYIKNEQNQITLFPNNERLKLASSVITQTINLNTLINLQFVKQIFSLHDQYELFGSCKSIQKAVSEEKHNYKKKPFDIVSEWNLDYLHPWISPTENICFYFGEKVGLYFEFTSYFIKFSTPMASLGLLFSVLMYISQNENNEIYTASVSIFSMLIVHWNSFQTDCWHQQQLIFNLKFGQNKNVKESIIRSSFKGENVRSIENDVINSIGVIHSKFIQRLIISIFILIFLIGSDIGRIVGLYFFNLYLRSKLDEFGNDFQYFEVIITASVNYVIQLLISQFYEQIATILTDFENFQTSYQYETSYIIKKYTLYCFSQVFPLLMVSFLNSPLQLYCKEENCKHNVEYYFGTTMMLMFLMQVIKFLMTFQHEMVKNPQKLYPYNQQSLCDFIEIQEKRIPFQKSVEKYGNIDEYMDFFVQLTLTNIFGCLFPFSITLFWIWNIIQVQISKLRLLFIFQRPWPKGDGSLGIWDDFYQLINYITLLCNTGLICIYYYDKMQDQVIILFLALLFYNFFIKYLTNSIFGTSPMIVGQIMKRSLYIFKSNVQSKLKVNRSSQQDNKQKLQRCPLFKVYGSSIYQEYDRFETISSEDEIADYYTKNNKQISKRLVYQEEIFNIKMNQLNLGCRQQQQQLFFVNNQNTQKKIQTDSADQLSNQYIGSVKEFVKQETFTRRNMKSKIKDKIKKIKQVQKLNYEFLFKYYQKRSINGAFRIQSSQKGEKQLIQVRTKIWRFFFRLSLLSSYNMFWSDYRLYIAQSYIQRKSQLFHNLDQKRYQILKKSFDKQNEYYRNQAILKFRKQFQQFGNTLTSEEVKEFNELVYKYQNYIEKRAWLNCRKVQIFRYKGLFFRGFRKQTLRKQSINYALEYYEATKKLEEIQFESDIHKKFGTIVQYSCIHQYNFNKFIDLFNQLEYEQKKQFVFSSTNSRSIQKTYYLEQMKSEVYKNVIDKAKDTYIFEQHTQKVEEYTLQYFLDEINQIPKVKMKKHLHDILWIVVVEDKEYLMQFFQVRHGQQLQFQQYHNEGLGVYLAESKNYIKQLNILDQIDDFFIKGYCISLYQCSDCKSLYQVLQFRKKYALHYTLDELRQFMFANLQIMTKNYIRNVSIYNYILVQNEYMILNSVNQNNNQIWQLVQVIIEMIHLQPIEDFAQALQNLDHPLKYFLIEIIHSDKTPIQILDMMLDQKPFWEIDFQLAYVKKEDTYQIYMENMKHQINFHLRIKQFDKCLILIKEVEEYLRITHYQTTSELLPYFVNSFSKNLSLYILRSNEIKKVLDTLLIYYFKISSLFGVRKEFENDISQLIDGLKRCSAQIRVMFRQLSLNVKLENLSEIEQCIVLKRKLKQTTEKQSSISSFERLNLLNTLRKNQDYILVIVQYQTQLQRYLNQFQTIKAIDYYFNQNYIMAGIQYLEIISNQEQLVLREPAPQFLNVPLDHSPGLINLEQSSPLEDEQIAAKVNTDTRNDCLINGDQLYCTQLLYLKFLYLINLYDCKNEQFQFYYNDFQELNGVYEPVFKFYQNQLKLLRKEGIAEQDLDEEMQCEIGKYLCINIMKWQEICNHKYLQLFHSNDDEIIKRQIIIFSNLQRTLENRKLLLSIINTKSPISLDSYNCLFQIKLIQQIMHLDNSQPISHSIPSLVKTKSIKFSHKISYIRLLQEYHNQFKIKKDSWFFQQCLEELQMFFFLSICFAYSPKHIENLGQAESEISTYAVQQIKKYQSKPKFYCQILKCTQINNKQAGQFLIDSSLTKHQQYQIFCQFLNCSLKQHSSLKNSIQMIQEIITDEIQPSIIILGLLHSFLYLQQLEIVDLIYCFTSRLIQSQAYIFHRTHPGFEQDLSIIESLYKDSNQCIPYPERYLYEYTKEFKYFDDTKFHSQYLLFNILMNQDYFLIQEILQESISQLKNQPNLIRYFDLYKCYLEVVNSMTGQMEPKQQFILKLNDYREGTLIYAILAHFQCKYYINLIDFENALNYSHKVLQYINTFLKQEKIIVSIMNDTLHREYPINATLKQLKILEYEYLIDEREDSDYIHLFNNEFMNEAILNHIRILINLEQNVPKINLLFQLQLGLENKLHISYLQMIYAEYFKFLQTIEDQTLIVQLIDDPSNQIDEIKQKIQNEEKKQQAYYSLKLNILADVTEIDYRLKILDFQLSVFQAFKLGLNNKLINNWASQSAQRAIDGYLKILPIKQQMVHPYVSIMYLIQCESYQFLNQIQKSQNMIDLAEISLKSWFDDNKHTLKGLFFFAQGNHCRWLYKQYLRCVKEIIGINQFDAVEVKVLAQGLIDQDPQIIKIFDYYHSGIIKQILGHLTNFIYSQIGKHVRQNIFYKYKVSDAKDILDDIIFLSSIKELNGITQYLDALAIFNHFETEHKCIDIIKCAIIAEN